MRFFLIIVLLITFSCSYPELVRNEIVYYNDFNNSSSSDSNVDGYSIINYNGELMLGNFNNDGFSLHVENVGKHDYITVSFDLYIHGSWDGNTNGFSENDKPDKWIVELLPEMELFNEFSINSFVTTFSNSTCFSNYCLKQSYPESFPFDNNPQVGAINTNLPEVCANSFFGGKTTLYKIEKTFRSSGNNIILRFYDELYQPNAIDKNGTNQQKCDESWSLDNLKLRVIDYK